MNPLTIVSFEAHGIPVTQGSKKAMRNRHTGKTVMVESSERHGPWRALVSLAAQEAMETGPTSAAVNLAAVFRFPRPKSHYRSGKNAHLLSDSSPHHHTNTPDLDKLVRCVCDSMTGIVWNDDSQVASLDGTCKVWVPRGESGGVTIGVDRRNPRVELVIEGSDT